MNKSYLGSTATLLLLAGVALGQTQAPPPTLAKAKGDAAFCLVTLDQAQGPPASLPPPEQLQGPPAVCNGVEEGPSFFAEPGKTSRGVFTAALDYAVWFLANPRDSTTFASTDVLGGANTHVLGTLGDAEHENGRPSSGARLALGYWDVQDNPFVAGGVREQGAETVFFFVGQRSVAFTDDTSANIVRPFFDLNNRQESGFIVAAPGLATGGVLANAQASVWGAEANVWQNVYCDYPNMTCSVSLMAGFRYLDLDERINVGSVTTFDQNLAAFPAYLALAGNTVQVSDSFAAHNRFYGGQVGVSGTWWPVGNFVVEGVFKLGVGETAEDLTIAGGQLRTLANGTKVSSAGGLLALPSNIGQYHIDKFSQVPELDLKISAPLTPHLTLSTGFSAVYWSRVLRPGQQIGSDLDITQIPNFPPGALATPTGLNQPGVSFTQSSLAILGITLGLEVKY